MTIPCPWPPASPPANLLLQFPSGGVLPYLQQRFGRPQDVFIVNFAIWHRKTGATGMASYGASLRALGQYYQVRRSGWWGV